MALTDSLRELQKRKGWQTWLGWTAASKGTPGGRLQDGFLSSSQRHSAQSSLAESLPEPQKTTGLATKSIHGPATEMIDFEGKLLPAPFDEVSLAQSLVVPTPAARDWECRPWYIGH